MTQEMGQEIVGFKEPKTEKDSPEVKELLTLMLPCPISVYVENGRTYISTLRLRVISDFYPQADITAIAEEVDEIVLSIVEESK